MRLALSKTLSTLFVALRPNYYLPFIACIEKVKEHILFGLFAISKNNGHLPSKVLNQPIEKNIYDPNSSPRLKYIKRRETELKWIKFLQSPFPFSLQFKGNRWCKRENVKPEPYLRFISFLYLDLYVLENDARIS